MQKIFLFLLFSLTASVAQAQFALFNSNSELFFNQANTNDELVGLKPDSVQISGNDSTYYHYRIQEIIAANCETIKGISWIGKLTLRLPNGDYYFFNSTNDTILIKTAAPLNQSWTCYKFSNGDYIKATVVSQQFEPTFDGLSDTVKTVAFTVYNSGNTQLSHPYNSITYKFSKQQGIIKWGNMHAFPANTITYSRCFGKRLTNADHFNMNPGEILQRRDFASSPNGALETFKTFTCTAKSVQPSSVSYTFNTYTWQKTSNPQSTTITTSYATQTSSIQNPQQYLFTQMPQQSSFTVSGTTVMARKISYYSNPTDIYHCNFSIYAHDCFTGIGSVGDTCFGASVSCMTNSWNYYFLNHGRYYQESSGPSNPYLYSSEMKYFLHDGVSCGAYLPVATNEIRSSEKLFSVFPNPVNERLEIKTIAAFPENSEVEILDLTGRLIFSKPYSQSVDVSMLNDGVYILNVKSDKGESRIKFVKSAN